MSSMFLVSTARRMVSSCKSKHFGSDARPCIGKQNSCLRGGVWHYRLEHADCLIHLAIAVLPLHH